MENYIADYLSLPEQVLKNKKDICKILGSKWQYDIVTLTPEQWEILGNSRYQYQIKNNKYKDDMLFFVVGNDEKSAIDVSDFVIAQSYNGGINIISNKNFDYNITIIIYYSFNIQN